MLEQKVCIKLQKILQKCICSSKTAVYMLHQKCRFLPNMPVSRFDSSCDSLENYHMATAVCIEETLMVWHVSLWFFPPLSCCTLLEFEKHYNSLCLAIILPSSVSCSLATCEMCFSSFLHKEVKFAYQSSKCHLIFSTTKKESPVHDAPALSLVIIIRTKLPTVSLIHQFQLRLPRVFRKNWAATKFPKVL